MSIISMRYESKRYPSMEFKPEKDANEEEVEDKKKNPRTHCLVITDICIQIVF